MTTGEWRQARVGTPHLSPVAELAHRAAATLAIWFAVLGGALTAWPLAAVAVVLGTGTCAVRVRPSAAVAVVLGAAITCWLLMIARDPTATITLP